MSRSYCVNIRCYQPGDDGKQLSIYNTAGALLPKFKPATLFEIQRRTQAGGFDAGTRWFAEDQGKPVAYATFQANGRVSYPWCLPGHDSAAQPLFEHVQQVMKQRGIGKAFAAYRGDWPTVNGFFRKEGFVHARDMVNFVLPFENMPTSTARLSNAFSIAKVTDMPKIFALAPSVFRVASAEALKESLWNNPYFKPESLFVMRNRTDGSPLAAALFITDPTYADPRAVDSAMPCFRLGAFGTEGMTTKRIKGMFSFVASLDKNLLALGMDLLSFAAGRLTDDDEIACYAAQVASDVPPLHAFYQRNFERQGSFPVYEKDLTK